MPQYVDKVVLAPVGNGWLHWLNTTVTANVCQWLKLQLLSFMLGLRMVALG
jgi:hypothetical protein